MSMNAPFTNEKLSSNTLMEEFKAMVVEKFQFEYRDISK